MIDKINSNQIQELLAKSSRQSNSAEIQNDNNLDVSLEVNYASLIKKAMEAAESDDNAVQEAKELLSSGQLESEEKIRDAAENIIKFGA